MVWCQSVVSNSCCICSSCGDGGDSNTLFLLESFDMLTNL